MSGGVVTYEISFSLLAIDDLANISDWVTGEAGSDVADGYTDRIAAACRRLRIMPNRGTPRDDLHPGWRSTAFERRATILYRIEGDMVVIERVVARGRGFGPPD